MVTKRLKRMTKGERAYVADMSRISALDLIQRGRARILRPDEYPEPIKRFLQREQVMVHVKLTAALKRKLEARSREIGLPVSKLAKRWIEQGIKREVG